MGKPRVVAETGAGQDGVASPLSLRISLECVVYDGHGRYGTAGAHVARCVCSARSRRRDSGSRTLKDAINEAMRDWVTNVRTTHYLLARARPHSVSHHGA